MGMPHLKKKALSIVTPAIHRTLFCGLSKTVLGGDDCEVFMAVTMHSLVFYTVMCALVTYLPIHNITSQKTVIPVQCSWSWKVIATQLHKKIFH